MGAMRGECGCNAVSIRAAGARLRQPRRCPSPVVDGTRASPFSYDYDRSITRQMSVLQLYGRCPFFADWTVDGRSPNVGTSWASPFSYDYLETITITFTSVRGVAVAVG